MRKLVYGSICSGISAESVAWKPLGWSPAWFSEVAAFPSAVLTHHYPDIPNLGDANEIHEKPQFHARKIDLLVGGTPCQSFSQAGQRQGFEDPRGRLALRFLEIAGMLRPRWLLWENVPEVLSSRGGRDFLAFIRKMGELGYGHSWHVLDAQHFGVPQARCRLFVVGYLGSWERAAALFADREIVRQNHRPDEGAADSHAGHDGSRPSQAGAETISIQGNLIGREDGAGPYGKGWRTGAMYTLTATDKHAIIADGVARYILPVEAERLQGLPDGYTKIPYQGQPAEQCPDDPRYEAIGNAMCVPVMRWLGERIAFVDSLPEGQVASLLCAEDFAKTLPPAELIKRCEQGFRNLKDIIPYLREARNRWAQPGRHVPVPGKPTWTEWVKQNLGVSVRTVQRALRDALEPRDKVSQGRSKAPRKLRTGDWRSLMKGTEGKMSQVFGSMNDDRKLAAAACEYAQAIVDRYSLCRGGKFVVSVTEKG